MELLPIIILASGGLAVCVFYLLYQFFLLKKSGDVHRKPVAEEKFEYIDEYEDGDSLIINLKNY